MFINPKQAIDEGWITGIANPATQVQPNAIDFTADKIFSIKHGDIFSIATNTETGKDIKNMRRNEPLVTYDNVATGVPYWVLYPNTCYDVLSDVYVNVPEGVAAMLIARSTFTRNGLFIVSGLYDSGFRGHIGCILHNNSGVVHLSRGVRLGQIIFVKSESAHLYAGSWNHDESTVAPHQAV